MVTRSRRTAAEALGALVDHRGPALLGYTYLLTLDLPDAEDLLQDALVKVLPRAGWVAPVALEAYVRRAALTLFIDRSRRMRRYEALAVLRGGRTHHRGPDEFVPARVDVSVALRDLPPRQRACVVLRYFDDLPVRDIAERVGVGEGTVKRYLHLAARRLAGTFDVEGGSSSADDTTVVLER